MTQPAKTPNSPKTQKLKPLLSGKLWPSEIEKKMILSSRQKKIFETRDRKLKRLS